MLRPSQVEDRVRQILRERRIIAPPVPVTRIAQSLGAAIRKEPFEGETDVSGALDRSGPVPIIGINSNHHPVRQRFTIAHEIGHLLFHAGPLHVDPAHQVGVVPNVAAAGPTLRLRRDKVSSQATDSREIEANRFAAALLMPQDFLGADLAGTNLPLSTDEIQRLARRYYVSQQAMTFRLMNLGVPMETT